MTMTKQETTPHYPEIQVALTGQDGNAFMVLGLVQRAMRSAGCTPEQVKEYMDDAMSGDYHHLLQVTMSYVGVI